MKCSNHFFQAIYSYPTMGELKKNNIKLSSMDLNKTFLLSDYPLPLPNSQQTQKYLLKIVPSHIRVFYL